MSKKEILAKIESIFIKVDKLPDNTEVTTIQNELSSLHAEVQHDVWNESKERE